ncbi:CRISPR-associated endonuclease Cas2 [Candidatus Berkelbacteria bacterium RBG_13_40_8]|uniref:CRISPR-associated endoribonuclease Cas2 n=1 Tax=Candidatus Berkelbacteria bacterium RBG_13_40_8 TaxID=1797467 RepID=A0A1F5DQF1_9BACT|nr:MAG: CRISPR-associated endonuclease Cas2 [Candidatus Berkelbacteria bacterium RBG_13_40_8]
MALSTMQEILILLEDEKEVPLFRLNRWGKATRGVLAKLKNLGWAERVKKADDLYYRITEKGEDYFDETLSVLRETDKWDQKWRLVMFDIPETQRAIRDKLRRALSNLGLGILQASVWISARNIKDKIDKISQRLKLEGKIRYFEVTANTSLNHQIIEKAWNLPEVNLDLERFIKNANHALKNMGKGNGDRCNAKKLIFEYALILKKDPKLPLEFTEQNDIRRLARAIYLKLRHYAI